MHTQQPGPRRVILQIALSLGRKQLRRRLALRATEGRIFEEEVVHCELVPSRFLVYSFLAGLRVIHVPVGVAVQCQALHLRYPSHDY